MLKKFHSYLPKKGNGKVDGQLFTGDQLSVERGANVISSVANGMTQEDRLEGIHMQLGDWHTSVKILNVSKFSNSEQITFILFTQSKKTYQKLKIQLKALPELDNNPLTNGITECIHND